MEYETTLTFNLSDSYEKLTGPLSELRQKVTELKERAGRERKEHYSLDELRQGLYDFKERNRGNVFEFTSDWKFDILDGSFTYFIGVDTGSKTLTFETESDTISYEINLGNDDKLGEYERILDEIAAIEKELREVVDRRDEIDMHLRRWAFTYRYTYDSPISFVPEGQRELPFEEAA
ncbi:MAG: hypothetical protein HYW25_03590 [Candidatus Aenigmarchaeota archaeon]|nr:hypothetical protein [Candidatus Aenigmarchaeota archaeon]